MIEGIDVDEPNRRAGDRMTIFSFSEVLPLSDLVRIVVVDLLLR